LFLEKNKNIDVRFIVVGDGELRDKLKDHSIKSGLSNYVQFCGWIKDVSNIYADLDILALTSLNEGTPTSIIEAMASSVPVISTDVGGVSDLLGPDRGILQNGFTVCKRGILCNSKDVYGFASGLRYLIHISAKERERQISDARNYVENDYAKNNLINEIENIYSRLIEDKF